jgi:hypothetical protein
MSKKFYDQYVLSISNTIPPETMPVRYGRELAYFIACNAGNEDCLIDTRILGDLDVKGVRMIPRGLEHPVLCSYFKQRTIESEWREVFFRMNRLIQNVDYTLKTNYINALACTNSDSVLLSYLESSLNNDVTVNYTQSDRRNVFYAVLGNKNGIEAATKMLNNHAATNKPVEAYGWSWQRILLNIADSIHTEAEREVYLQFLNTFEHNDVTRDLLDRVIRESNYNIDAQKEAHNVRQMELIRAILEREFGTIVTTTTTTTTTPGTITTTIRPPTTTPDSGCSLKLSSILLGLGFILIMKF